MRSALSGSGAVEVAAARDLVWSALLDPEVLRLLIPGADEVERLDHDRYRARLSFGVGRLRGRYDVGLQLTDMRPKHALELAGQSSGLLGGGRATARVRMTEVGPALTSIAWSYDGVITGAVAMAGRRLLRASSLVFVDRFFTAFARHAASLEPLARPSGEPCL